MKYCADVVIHRAGSLKPRFVSKLFDSRADAIEFRSEVLGKLGEHEYANWAKVYPVVRCPCGEDVDCQSFTNECDCGADYNFNGTRLAPRSQWGEETGESWWEII